MSTHLSCIKNSQINRQYIVGNITEFERLTILEKLYSTFKIEFKIDNPSHLNKNGSYRIKILRNILSSNELKYFIGLEKDIKSTKLKITKEKNAIKYDNI